MEMISQKRPATSEPTGIIFGKIIRVTSGAKTKCTKSYIIPAVEPQPDAIVIHYGTNDLRRQKQPE